MKIEKGKLYTHIQVLEFLSANKESEIRMLINIPGRKNLRALMYDDGEKYYSIDETEYTLKSNGRNVSKCIFNEGFVTPMIKVINDDFVD